MIRVEEVTSGAVWEVPDDACGVEVPSWWEEIKDSPAKGPIAHSADRLRDLGEGAHVLISERDVPALRSAATALRHVVVLSIERGG